MSDAVEYRRLVSHLAAKLRAEEVERVAYIRLADSQSTDKYNAKEPKATGLQLLDTLERQGKFSQENLDGLLEIAKDVGRRDLVDKVEEYKAKCSRAGKCARKKPRRLLNEDQQQRDRMIVTKLAVLQKHVSLLQRALSGGTDTPDEAMVLLRSMEDIMQKLISKLHQPHLILSTRSHNDSNSSSSNGSSGTSEGSTTSSPVDASPIPSLQQEPSECMHGSNACIMQRTGMQVQMNHAQEASYARRYFIESLLL